jgi:hypothetical protein
MGVILRAFLLSTERLVTAVSHQLIERGTGETSIPSAPPRPAILLMTIGYVEGSAYTESVQTTHAAVLSTPVDIDELRDQVQHVLARLIGMADGGH